VVEEAPAGYRFGWKPAGVDLGVEVAGAVAKPSGAEFAEERFIEPVRVLLKGPDLYAAGGP
jgi:hypothetical protein